MNSDGVPCPTCTYMNPPGARVCEICCMELTPPEPSGTADASTSITTSGGGGGIDTGGLSWGDYLKTLRGPAEVECAQVQRKYGDAYNLLSSSPLVFSINFKSTDPEFSYPVPADGIVVRFTLTNDFPSTAPEVLVPPDTGLSAVCSRVVEKAATLFFKKHPHDRKPVRSFLTWLDRNLQAVLLAAGDTAKASDTPAPAPAPAAAPASSAPPTAMLTPAAIGGAGGVGAGANDSEDATGATSGAGGVGSVSAAGWACSVCTFENPIVAITCSACGMSNSPAAAVAGPPSDSRALAVIPGQAAKTVVHSGRRPATIDCPECTYSNPGARLTCAMCSTTLPVPTEEPEADPLVQASAELDTLSAELDGLQTATIDEDAVARLKVIDGALTAAVLKLDGMEITSRTERIERKKMYNRVRGLEATVNRLMPQEVLDQAAAAAEAEQAAVEARAFTDGSYATSGAELGSSAVEVVGVVNEGELPELVARVNEKLAQHDERKAEPVDESKEESKGDRPALPTPATAVPDEGTPAVVQPPPVPEPEPEKSAEERAAEALTLKEVGNAMWRAKDYAAAERAYLQGIALDPRNVALYNNLAAAQLHLGKYEDVRASSSVVLELTDNMNAKALFRRAKANLHLGNKTGAREDAEAALKLDEGNESVITFLGALTA